MGENYDHLTLEERCRLRSMIEMGLPKTEMARRLGRHRSTIYRELDRNSNVPGYRPDGADRLAWARKLRGSRIGRSTRLRGHIEDRLAMGWSPEQIELARTSASGSSSVNIDLDGAPFGASKASGLDGNFTSFGYSGTAGVEFDLTPNLTVDLGAGFESWEIPSLDFEPERKAKITDQRRNSWTGRFGVRIRF